MSMKQLPNRVDHILEAPGGVCKDTIKSIVHVQTKDFRQAFEVLWRPLVFCDCDFELLDRALSFDVDTDELPVRKHD